jgi:hypothetical protein
VDEFTRILDFAAESEIQAKSEGVVSYHLKVVLKKTIKRNNDPDKSENR